MKEFGPTGYPDELSASGRSWRERLRDRFFARSEITPEITAQLETQATSLSAHIQFKGFETPFQPNPQALAQILLTMAYLRGGATSVAQVNDFILDHGGLEVSLRGGLAAGSVEPNAKPIKVKFTPRVIIRSFEKWSQEQSDSPQQPVRQHSAMTRILDHLLSASPAMINHELFHLVQLPGEKRLGKEINNLTPVILAGLSSIFIFNKKIPPDNDAMMATINFITNVGLAVMTGIYASFWLKPSEAEAYFRTGIPGPWNLTRNPYIRRARSQLFLRPHQSAPEESLSDSASSVDSTSPIY